MTETLPQFSVALHRIEVHAGNGESARDDMVWSLSAAEDVDGGVNLMGYLRRAQPEGFGQVQVFAFTGDWNWKAAARNKAARAEFSDWVHTFAAEAMFDTARRAIQAQAAMMDFYFDIEISAPVAEVNFKKRSSPPRGPLTPEDLGLADSSAG